MFQIDPLSLIPDALKTAVRDAAVDFVSSQAKKILGDELGNKIKKLRSDAGFAQKFDQGLQKAIKRFADEYFEKDEDLVAAIEADPSVFKNEQVQKALLEMLKNPGKYLADEHETVAENFSSVLPGRKNRERVDKAMAFLLRCLAEELWNLPELQPIYSLQFQKMTAESMHQQVELQKMQLRALTTVNEGVRQALLQLTDAIAEKKLLPAPGVSITPIRPKVLHNLPQPDYGDFVGREKELTQITSLLSSKSRHFLVMIDGIGGIGKSALALEIAHRFLRNHENLQAEERFDAIIWASAKMAILTTSGVLARPHRITTIESIYSTIATALDHPDFSQVPRGKQFDTIVNLLTAQRTLLVIDNLEMIEDKEIISFLWELPNPTKCIITSRHRFNVAYPIRLEGMNEEEGFSLIRDECERRCVALTREQSQKLFRRTGGVPLAIVLSMAQISRGLDINTVLARLGKHTDDIAHFCFDFSLEKISSSAWKLLMALALFSSGTTSDILGRVTELDPLDLNDALVELEEFSLANRLNNKYWLPPLFLEYVQDKMNHQPGELIARLKHKFAKAYMYVKIESTELAKAQIDAVHLAIDLSDLLVWDTTIADYLRANRRAVNRGVIITRIFVLEKDLTYLPQVGNKFNFVIERILDDQMHNGIDVRILWMDTVRELGFTELADMIIFDGQEVHIHKGHGGYYLDVDIPIEQEEIRLWQLRFAQWKENSIPWYIMRKEIK